MSLYLYPAVTQLIFDGWPLSVLCGTFTDCRAAELTQFTLDIGVAPTVKLLQKSSKPVGYLRFTVESWNFSKLL
jgi:hypothetical protein|tara:strand:- start:982 stop:1203 length:222 start_codon:yes stop_codon:yes gene_type:complete